MSDAMPDTTASSNTGLFTFGGTVQAGGGLYIPRQADEELLAVCRRHAFAYVLTPRQLGKSSLMVRTAERLETEGTRTVIIDLSQIGVEVTAEEWYMGLLSAIDDRLELDTDIFAWWTRHRYLGVTQRLTDFFEKVMLAEVEEPVVIFVDEIDSTLSLSFADDFYAAVRYIHNARAVTPGFKRLSFVLIGVATPSDLISDATRTPFNIGHRVDLTDFTEEEARPFTKGFGLTEAEAVPVLRRVLYWTNGHPYLTQRFCGRLAEQRRAQWTEQEVDAVVAATFFGARSAQVDNLQFVRDMLTKRAPDNVAVLEAYRAVRMGQAVPDEERSAVKSHLKLSGVVRVVDGVLVMRNRIYETVFDLRWVRAHWPESFLKRHAAFVAAASLILLFIALVVFGISQRSSRAKAEDSAREAQEQRDVARLARQEAEDSAFAAQEQRDAARLARQAAEDNARVARQQRRRAVESAAEAERQRQAAEDNARTAQQQRRLADSLSQVAQDSTRAAQEERDQANAERRATTQARLQTLGLALAGDAVTQLELGNAELGALLAREAFRVNQESEGDFLNEVYNALHQTLNALDSTYARYTQEGDWVTAITYGPDGPVAAPNGTDGYAFGDTVNTLSPDGRYRAEGYPNGIVHLIDTVIGDTMPMRGHEGPVTAVAFSKDGRWLASGSGDHTIRLWQVKERSNRPIVLQEHNDWVLTLAFSPDGERLASGSTDKTVRTWTVNPQRLAERVCAVVTRSLSEEEWLQFVGADISYDDYEPCHGMTR